MQGYKILSSSAVSISHWFPALNRERYYQHAMCCLFYKHHHNIFPSPTRKMLLLQWNSRDQKFIRQIHLLSIFFNKRSWPYRWCKSPGWSWGQTQDDNVSVFFDEQETMKMFLGVPGAPLWLSPGASMGKMANKTCKLHGWQKRSSINNYLPHCQGINGRRVR